MGVLYYREAAATEQDERCTNRIRRNELRDDESMQER